jgi:hypothetical protein
MKHAGVTFDFERRRFCSFYIAAGGFWKALDFCRKRVILTAWGRKAASCWLFCSPPLGASFFGGSGSRVVSCIEENL